MFMKCGAHYPLLVTLKNSLSRKLDAINASPAVDTSLICFFCKRPDHIIPMSCLPGDLAPRRVKVTPQQHSEINSFQ